jgi:hypothetical protein
VVNAPIDPNDNNACTADSCNPATGVVNTPIDPNDNNACTTDSCNPATGVVNTPIDPNYINACTTDSCNPATGVVNTPIDPNDNNACTADSCNPATGVVNAPIDPNDNNACTTDSCNPATGVVNTPIDPNDNNACTTDSCNPATGVVNAPIDPSDGVACTDDACDPVTGVSHTPNNASCPNSDGYTCTVPTCHLTLGCQQVPSDALCDDMAACTTADTCVGASGDPTTGCSYTRDNSMCRRWELCQTGGCAPAGAGGQAGDLVITELRVLGAEAVELYNASSTAIDIRGFELENFALQTADIRHASDPDGTAMTPVMLAPGAYAYGVPNPASAGSVPAGAAFVYGAPGTSFALADTGDLLSVFSAGGGTLHDYVDFRSYVTTPTAPLGTAFPGFAGKSTQLDPSQSSAAGNDSGLAWCITFRSADTLGAANQGCSVAVINEAFIDPIGADDGKAFIELAGPGGGTIGGAMLEDVEGRGASAGNRNQSSIVLPAGLRIPVDGFLVVADETGTTGTTQVANADVIVNDADFENTGGDAIQLVAPGGTMLLDAVGTDAAGNPLDVPNALFNGLPMYEGAQTALFPPTDTTLARDANSADTGDNRADFHGDPTPTPGTPNDAVAFSITSVTPDDALGGVTTPGVSIIGTDLAIGAQVLFDTLPATGCFTTPTRITCTAPSLPGGQRVDVTVTNPISVGGTGTLTSAFTYTGVRNETDTPAEVDYCNLQFPPTISVQTGQMTPLVYGRIYEAGLTEPPGADGTILAELGYGPAAANPTTQAGWLWFPATFNLQVGNDDEYMAGFTAPAAGTYAYTYRFSLDSGLTFTYCDLDGAGSNAGLAFDPAQLGSMTVTP